MIYAKSVMRIPGFEPDTPCRMLASRNTQWFEQNIWDDFYVTRFLMRSIWI